MAKKGVKVETLDKTFREAYRDSVGRTCEARNIYWAAKESGPLKFYENCPFCGNIDGGGDDVAHYYGRHYRGGRWHPDNVAFLCRQIHQYVDSHESIKVRFFTNLLGEGRHDILVERMHRNFHYTPANRREMHLHYREEHRRIKALRATGELHDIPMIAYD